MNETWGPKEIGAPHFNFQSGQEVDVLYVVTAQGYDLYIDRVLFKRFAHVVPPSTVTRFDLVSEGRLALILTFRR